MYQSEHSATKRSVCIDGIETGWAGGAVSDMAADRRAFAPRTLETRSFQFASSSGLRSDFVQLEKTLSLPFLHLSSWSSYAAHPRDGFSECHPAAFGPVVGSIQVCAKSDGVVMSRGRVEGKSDERDERRKTSLIQQSGGDGKAAPRSTCDKPRRTPPGPDHPSATSAHFLRNRPVETSDVSP